MSNKYIFTVNDNISAEGFGVKAANLNQLNRLDYLIPSTAFLNVSAFDETLKNIERAIKPGNMMNPVTFSERMGSIALPEQLLTELLTWCNEIGGAVEYHLAVRSSSTHEDRQDFSFAGLYRSVLYVKPEPAELERAIKQVWTSARSAEVLHYCQNNGVEACEIKMGVIIQQMVEADFSGVLFTGNPQDGSDDIRLEFVRGVGESLVSGEQTPVSALYRRQTSSWKEYDVNSGPDQKLLTKLVVAGMKIEKNANRPVDIEWAILGEDIFYLQFRPITVYISKRLDEIEWTNENVGEVIPDVVTPFSWSILGPMVNEAVIWFLKKLSVKHYPQEGLFGLYKGKVYFNSTRFHQLINSFYPSAYFSINNKKGFFFKINMAARFLRFSALALIFIILLPRRIKKLLNFDLPKAEGANNRHDNMKIISNLIRLESECMTLHIAATIFAEVFYQAVKKFSFKWFTEDEIFSAENIMLGATKTPGAESGSALWQLSRVIKNNSQAYKIFKDSTPSEIESNFKKISASKVSIQINEYFMNHGHNSLHEFELLYPRWYEDKVYVYTMIKKFLNMNDEDDPAEKRQKLHEAGIDNRRRAYQKLNLFQRWIFKYLINSTIHFSEYRERLKQRFLKLHRRQKLSLISLAHDMNFGDPLNILFIDIGEIKSLIASDRGYESVEKIIQSRQLQRSESMDYNHPPKLIQFGERWKEIWSDESKADGELSGIGCSGGIVEGRVRVIRQVEEFGNLREGEILVAQSTNPSWTPMFLLASGIVTEIGGALSHGAIIAREYGKPMVVAVPGATERLKNGDWIRIDGGAGRVLIFEEPEKLRVG